MSNIVISIICVLMQVGFLILLHDNELINQRIKRRFFTLTILLFFELLLDNLALYYNGASPGWVFPMKIIKAAEFIIAVSLPMFVCSIIVRKNFWTRIRYVFFAIIGVNSILQLASIFFDWMFRIDENAFYHTTFGTWVYTGFLFIGVCLIVFSSFKTYVQNFNRLNAITYIVSFIIAGVVVRAIISNYSIDSLILSIALYMFMIYFSNSFIKIDLLTTLLNQTTYFSRISSINYSTAIIQIDMNNFKHINDTRGHKKGDEILRLVGETIFEVYGDIGYCFRRGGDEFAVILKPRALERMQHVMNSGVYEEIDKYVEKLDKKIERLSPKVGGLLDDGLAQGYGIYYTYADCFQKGEYKEIKEVIDYADQELFEDKKTKKAKRAST